MKPPHTTIIAIGAPVASRDRLWGFLKIVGLLLAVIAAVLAAGEVQFPIAERIVPFAVVLNGQTSEAERVAIDRQFEILHREGLICGYRLVDAAPKATTDAAEKLIREAQPSSPTVLVLNHTELLRPWESPEDINAIRQLCASHGVTLLGVETPAAARPSIAVESVKYRGTATEATGLATEVITHVINIHGLHAPKLKVACHFAAPTHATIYMADKVVGSQLSSSSTSVTAEVVLGEDVSDHQRVTIRIASDTGASVESIQIEIVELDRVVDEVTVGSDKRPNILYVPMAAQSPPPTLVFQPKSDSSLNDCGVRQGWLTTLPGRDDLPIAVAQPSADLVAWIREGRWRVVVLDFSNRPWPPETTESSPAKPSARAPVARPGGSQLDRAAISRVRDDLAAAALASRCHLVLIGEQTQIPIVLSAKSHALQGHLESLPASLVETKKGTTSTESRLAGPQPPPRQIRLFADLTASAADGHNFAGALVPTFPLRGIGAAPVEGLRAKDKGSRNSLIKWLDLLEPHQSSDELSYAWRRVSFGTKGELAERSVESQLRWLGGLKLAVFVNNSPVTPEAFAVPPFEPHDLLFELPSIEQSTHLSPSDVSFAVVDADDPPNCPIGDPVRWVGLSTSKERPSLVAASAKRSSPNTLHAGLADAHGVLDLVVGINLSRQLLDCQVAINANRIRHLASECGVQFDQTLIDRLASMPVSELRVATLCSESGMLPVVRGTDSSASWIGTLSTKSKTLRPLITAEAVTDGGIGSSSVSYLFADLNFDEAVRRHTAGGQYYGAWDCWFVDGKGGANLDELKLLRVSTVDSTRVGGGQSSTFGSEIQYQLEEYTLRWAKFPPELERSSSTAFTTSEAHVCSTFADRMYPLQTAQSSQTMSPSPQSDGGTIAVKRGQLLAGVAADPDLRRDMFSNGGLFTARVESPLGATYQIVAPLPPLRPFDDHSMRHDEGALSTARAWIDLLSTAKNRSTVATRPVLQDALLTTASTSDPMNLSPNRILLWPGQNADALRQRLTLLFHRNSSRGWWLVALWAAALMIVGTGVRHYRRVADEER